MKSSLLCATVVLIATSTTSTALSLAYPDQAVLRDRPTGSERYLIELGPGETRWVTEDEKWAFRRLGINFMDITDTGDLGAFTRLAATDKGTEKGRGTFPTTPACNDTVAPLLKQLSKKNMRKHLETFTSFFTRYYKSRTGAQASSWLLDQVSEIVEASGAGQHGASVKAFQHPWGQDSIIATIPGRSAKTVVIGAHLDSINLFLPSLFAAPGADDDGSGTVTILEAFRVLLTRGEIVHGNASNTIEFHWYSAEEGGLLGSQAIFSAYEREGRDVRAMLQQDMTGYVHKTIAAGEPESVGIITDYVDPGLTDFIKQIVTYYCTIPYVLTKCGYACSDHASAAKAGYPSAFVIESDFKYSDDKIHTTEDKIEYLSFDHMLQHARLTLGLVYELALADLD